MDKEERLWCELAAKMDHLEPHEYIRKHILEYKGVPNESARLPMNYTDIKSRISSMMRPFFQLLEGRIIMGRFRYKDFDAQYEKLYHDYTDDIKRCLKLYKDTRNVEYLVDAANYCWLETRFGTHPHKHFKSVDDGPHSKG